MKVTIIFDESSALHGDLIETVENAVGDIRRKGNETGEITVVAGNGLSHLLDEINRIEGVIAKSTPSYNVRNEGPKHKEPFWTKRGRKS